MIKKILYVLAIIVLLASSIVCLYIGKEVQNDRNNYKEQQRIQIYKKG